MIDNKKPYLFLDLDETLISAKSPKELKKLSKKIGKDNFKLKEDKFNKHDMEGYYNIYERPYLQEFLDEIFSKYNVSVWTAASMDYALFICENIIEQNDRKLYLKLFDFHCDLAEEEEKGMKNLKMLWNNNICLTNPKSELISEKNSLILDDHKNVSKTNKKNCVEISKFEFEKKDSENDTDLKDKLKEIEHQFTENK